MFPSPNRAMNQPSRRPPQPMGQAPANQPNGLNQNGQEPKSEAPVQNAWGAAQGMYGQAPPPQQERPPMPESQMRYGASLGQSTYPHQNPYQPPEQPQGGMLGSMGQPQSQPAMHSMMGSQAPLPSGLPAQDPNLVTRGYGASPSENAAGAAAGQALHSVFSQPAPDSRAPDIQQMPAGAQENTSGPMKPPMPYQRQNMPQQAQANRRLSPRQA